MFSSLFLPVAVVWLTMVRLSMMVMRVVVMLCVVVVSRIASLIMVALVSGLWLIPLVVWLRMRSVARVLSLVESLELLGLTVISHFWRVGSP